jgi:hypothetical protein
MTESEAVPIKQAGRMLGVSDRMAAALLRQGKLVEFGGDVPRQGRGRPPIYVTRSSVEEFARATHRVIREVSAAELRGRSAGLSDWLSGSARLMSKARAARIAEIDGQGAGGQVWVRFHMAEAVRRGLLACFWRQDGRGLFGARKFRIVFDGARANVFLRSTDAELDQHELARAITLAAAAVGREEERIRDERSQKRGAE